MSVVKSVQKFGRVRLETRMVENYGTFVTVRVKDGGLLISPTQLSDQDGPDCVICKMYPRNKVREFCIPIKLRRKVNIQDTVLVDELGNDQLLFRPTGDEV